MSTSTAIEADFPEYGIGKIKSADGITFHAGEWHVSQIHMIMMVSQSIDQHVRYFLPLLAGEFYDV